MLNPPRHPRGARTFFIHSQHSGTSAEQGLDDGGQPVASCDVERPGGRGKGGVNPAAEPPPVTPRAKPRGSEGRHLALPEPPAHTKQEQSSRHPPYPRASPPTQQSPAFPHRRQLPEYSHLQSTVTCIDKAKVLGFPQDQQGTLFMTLERRPGW